MATCGLLVQTAAAGPPAFSSAARQDPSKAGQGKSAASKSSPKRATHAASPTAPPSAGRRCGKRPHDQLGHAVADHALDGLDGERAVSERRQHAVDRGWRSGAVDQCAVEVETMAAGPGRWCRSSEKIRNNL